jgi:lysophospholipase L1-like esterase
MKNTLQHFKVLTINYAIFVTVLVTFELAGQVGYRLVKGRFLFEDPPNVIFKEHPYLSGVAKKNHRYVNAKGLAITTDSNGFRITRKGAYDKAGKNVVCLGGSTTFGTFVTDEDSWPYQLQEKLGPGYNVYNMGIPGYSTLEAMIQLITFVPELKPQFIIVYEGWNDIRNYHVAPHSPDYYWHGMSQKTNLEFGNRNYWTIFFIPKMIQNIWTWFRPQVYELKNAEVFSTNDPYVDSLYVRNMRTIKLLCEHLNAKMVFIPQVMNIDSLLHSTTTYAWTPHIQNNQMPRMMEGFNLLIQKAIKPDKHTLILNNILHNPTWTARDFADYGHFTRNGGDTFSKIILSAIKELETQKESRIIK